MLAALGLGFCSGLPFYLTGSTMQAWMKESGVDIGTIGLFALVGTPVALKFLWAPVFDRFTPLALGRRRGWMFLTQLALAAALVLMSRWNPDMPLGIFAVLAILVSFFSASQDIVIDAWRRESFTDRELGLASSLTINGYRAGMLVSSSGALLLSATMAWSAVYVIMGLIVAASSVFTFFAPEPKVDVPPPRNFQEAVVEPFVDYFKRPGAWLVLLFILCYKLGDNLASAMTMPLYLELGFTKPQIALVVKGLGIFGMITGGLLGGVLMLRWPLVRSLWIFGILQAVSTAGFAWLATQGASLPGLEGVIFFENFTAGMGTSAYAAYMGSITNRRFSATQYALLSSLMAVSRSFIAAPSGYLVKGLGWEGYFIFCAVIAIPGMLLLRYIPFHDSEPTPAKT